MSETFTHRPVLLNECIQALNIRPEGVYVDGTLGRAGHSREIARRLTTGRLICVDRDQAALEAAEERLAQWRDRVTLVHSNFDQIDRILNELSLSGADGMLFDLGVSSPQLDDSTRGFSYMADAPLDMRMDQSGGMTAAEVVNQWPQEELRRILYQYGEERYAPQIAAAIVRRRQDRPIQTTMELAQIVREARTAPALKEEQNPAKRSFQAIRIAVNDELASVDRMLQAAVPRLNPGGRLAVITFHSLEDRIVKTGLAEFARGCTCPPDFPVCVCGKKPQIRLVSRKPILPSEEEVRDNPRARSAKLRAAESVAYAPAYDGTAVRAPRREEVLRPKPRVRPRERVLTRTQVQVREAGQASVFAVIGFLAVGVFAALLLLSYTQYAVLTDQVVTLRSELTTLQTENATLSAEYEKVFDMERIQAAVGDTMIRPTGDQVEYIDLSEPDSVVVYGQEDAKTGIPGLLAGLEEIISSLIEYFR